MVLQSCHSSAQTAPTPPRFPTASYPVSIPRRRSRIGYIYTHREKRGGTNWSRLGCVAVCLEMAEVAEFAIGFLFHASCACLWSQHWLRRKISTINGSLKIVQVVFLCFSLINWCFKTQLTWHSNHGTKKKYVTTESNKKIIKDIDWYNICRDIF